MNDDEYVIWASKLSSEQVKFQFTRPDGQVEVNS